MKKFLLLLLVCFTIQSCFIGKLAEEKAMKKEFTEKNNAIPPDFGINENEILLAVTKDISRYDKKLIIALKKYYSGKYEIISSEDYKTEKYSDKSKYRFIFNCRHGNTSFNCKSEKTCFIAGYKIFYVYDRLKDIKYESGAEFGNYDLGANIYLQNLEIKRTSN
jgi:hypothetical protein